MTILLLSDIFPPRTGGSGRWFWEIYRRLPREQVVIAAGEDPRQEAFDRTHDLRVVRVPLNQPEWGIRSMRGLADYAAGVRRIHRLVRKLRIGLIHVGRILPEGWIAWLLSRLCGIHYLCYVHGEELNLGVHSREFGWMIRRIVHGADFLVANSQNTAALLQRHWNVPAGRVVVLHPGVDVERFVPTARSAERRESLGWRDRPVVLTVGRLQKRKGHDMMIRALAEIRRTVPDVLYAIVGDGEERSYLENLAGEIGVTEHVRFHGELSDDELIRAYQQCDLFVLANRDVDGDIEGFGMVLLEAQACGKPVIAGTSGGTAETMQVEQTGRIVPCDRPEELAGAVAQLLCQPEKCLAMGEAGRRWVEEQFSWTSLAQEAGELFRITAGEGEFDGPSDVESLPTTVSTHLQA